jgi:hypothetical protein
MNNTKSNKKTRPNAIVALCIVSESEIIKVLPDYSSEFENREYEFKEFLYSLGLDVYKPYVRQDGLQHRNRFNEIVICSRWVGSERLCADWVQSGHASRAAIDKASGSKLTEDIYRARYETEDAQNLLEARDKYTTITEEE